MIEKGRISALQMALIVFANVISTAILMVPGITYKYARQDMWISPIFSSLFGFFITYIVYRLHKLFPNETLIQYSQHILGRIPGKVLGLFFLFYYLHSFSITLRQYGDFLIGTYFKRTPMIVAIGILAFASAFAVRAGLEVLARLSDIFVPILVLLWLTIVLLLLPDLEVKNMFPIMENGIAPSLKGAVAPSSWNSLFFHLSSLLPFLVDRKQAMKWGAFSVAAVMVILFMTNLMTLLLFGVITDSFVYPVMSASRYISYADFFENLEAITMAIWIGGMFIKFGLFHYILVLNTAQWLNLSDYKPLAFPTGLLLVLYALWVFPSLSDQSQHLGRVSPFTHALFFIVIPVTLLLIALLRNKRKTI